MHVRVLTLLVGLEKNQFLQNALTDLYENSYAKTLKSHLYCVKKSD